MFLKFLRLLLRMKMKWNQVSWSDPEESFQTDASMMALKANQIATESERSSVRDRQPITGRLESISLKSRLIKPEYVSRACSRRAIDWTAVL